MKTTLLIMAAGIGSRFGTGIKQLARKPEYMDSWTFANFHNLTNRNSGGGDYYDNHRSATPRTRSTAQTSPMVNSEFLLSSICGSSFPVRIENTKRDYTTHPQYTPPTEAAVLPESPFLPTGTVPWRGLSYCFSKHAPVCCLAEDMPPMR